jgi:hypothetical protein
MMREGENGKLSQCATKVRCTHLTQVVVFPLALLNEIRELRRQKLGRHVCMTKENESGLYRCIAVLCQVRVPRDRGSFPASESCPLWCVCSVL